MPRKITHGNDKLDTLLAKQAQLQSSYQEVQAILATRRKTLDDLEKKIDEEKKWVYLYNMRELGEIIIAHFGEDFSQSACKKMLKYIFEIEDVKDFIAIEKEKCTAQITDVVVDTNTSDTIVQEEHGTKTIPISNVSYNSEEHEKETA